MRGSEDDTGLRDLLDLDGYVGEVGGGFWVKVSVRRMGPSELKPHGIDYSLTLHNPGGERVVGYDNAHPLTERRGMGRKRTPTGDHRHYRGQIEPYRFVSATKLMEDFWGDVERLLAEEGVP